MLEIVIEVDGTKVKATAFGSRMERPEPQVIGEVGDLEVFGKKVGRAVKSGKPLDPEVVEDARRLYDSLFGGEIRDVLTRIRAESPDDAALVRLLVRNRPTQAIPWEALCQPGTSEGFLAAGGRLDVVRGVSSSEPNSPHSIQGAIRVLPIAPNGDAGLVNLSSALESVIATGKLTWLDPITGEAAAPRRLFQRLRSNEPAHVIHFIGHGGVDVDGHPTLRVADDEYGEEVWIKAETLAGELAAGFGKELRLVVLEACDGATPGLLGSAAEILARAGAQAVIAYLWPVRADVARTCSEEFYRALTQSDRGRGDVAKSLSAARRTLLVDSAAGFSSVVYLRGADPILFDFGSMTTTTTKVIAVPAPEPARFLVPFKKNPLYVGRGAESQRLHELLQTNQSSGASMVALSGMGGIGKTLIAAEYAYQYRDAYPGGVYWVNAAQDWQVELGRIGKLAGCRPADGPAEQENLRFARAFAETLRTNSRALVIFDNVDNPLELQDVSLELVPAQLDCKLVFTTRRRELPSPEVFVGVLPEELALDLLLARSHRREDFDTLKPEERAAARAICKMLDGHPLAIAMAGAYLERNTRISFSGYLEGLVTEGALAVVDATRIDSRLLATQHEGNIGATLNVQWKSIQSDDARLTLRTAALLEESVVVTRARLALLTGLSDEPRSWREAPLEEALHELSSLSLLEDFGPKTIKLHRLVRELIVEQIPDREAFAAARATSVIDALWDLERLEKEISNRGIADVLADLIVARGLAKPTDVERLNRLIRPLDRVANSLQYREKAPNPGFFLQQLHKQALEFGIDEIAERARAVLDGAKMPWLRQCFPTSGESRALVRTLEGHLGGTHGIGLSADGALAVSAGADKTVKLWDWATGRLLRTLQGHTREVNGVAISPDGRRIISGSEDRSVRIWDAESGELIRTLVGHGNGIYRVAVTSDGLTAISASKDGTMRLWDLTTGQAIRSLDRSLSISKDAIYRAFAITDVLVTHDGNFVIASSQDKEIAIWDVATWRIVRTLSGHTDSVWSIAVDLQDRILVSASEDGSVKIWNLVTGICSRTIEASGSHPLAVALTNDSRFIIAGFRDGMIKVWNAATGDEINTLRGHSNSVIDIVTSMDSRYAISTSVDGTIRVWELDIPAEARNEDAHLGGIYDLLFFPDGRRLASASFDHTVKIHDVTTGKVLQTFAGHEKAVMALASTSDGRQLISASDDLTIRVWDVDTGKTIRVFEGHTDLVRGVALTPDNRYVISASYDCTLRVWDFATGLTMSVLEGHSLGVRDVVVTLDGRLAISASFDKTIKIWDIESGTLVHTLEGHVGPVWSLALTADGHFVISASHDCTLAIWEISTGQRVRTIEGHNGMVVGVAASEDGKTIYSTSGDMTVKAWDLASGREIVELDASCPLTSCAYSQHENVLAVGTSTGGLLLFWPQAMDVRPDKQTERVIDHLLANEDLVGRAALDVLLRVPRARALFEESGPDECAAGLLVVQMLGRASPAIEMAAAHFDVHPEASLVDYVDALGLEAMVEPGVSAADEAFWNADRIDSVRKAVFDVSWQSMKDADSQMVLGTVAIFDGSTSPSIPLLGLFTGMVGDDDAAPYARIETILSDIARRGWLEPKTGLKEIRLRPYVSAFIMKAIGDWVAFARARVNAFIATFSDIEKMEREVIRNGAPAVAADLRVGVLLAVFAGDVSLLVNRWRVFGREMQAFCHWSSHVVAAFFLQQLRNRALDMADEPTQIECETLLERRKVFWLRERFRVRRESLTLGRTYRGHLAEVRCVAIRADKAHMQFISGSDDRTVRSWDSVTGLQMGVFEGHAGAINDVALSPDQRYVASASEDGTIRKWDLWTNTLVHVFEGHDCPVQRVAIDSNGRYMVSAGADKTLRVWDFERGDIVQILGKDGDGITWMALSSDGTSAVLGSQEGPLTVQRFQDQSWQQVHVLQGHEGRVNDVVLMVDGRSALSASDDGTIKLWDIENGRLLRSFAGHTGAVRRVVPSGDDRHAMSVSFDKTMRLWDLVEGKELAVMRGHTDAIGSLDVHWPDNLAITASSDTTMRLWAGWPSVPDEPIEGHTSAVFGVAIARDGRYAISGGQDKTVCIWDLATGKLLRRIEEQPDISMGLAISPDGNTIFAGCDDGKVRLWDFSSGKLIREVDHGGMRVRGMAVTLDGKVAISACYDKQLRVWNVETGNVIRVLEGHSERVRAVAFTPDDRYCISASFDQSLRMWDWRTGKTIRVLQGHTAAVWSVIVTADGRHAISGSFDRTVRVWELATGRLVRTFDGHMDWVMSVGATADGRRIFSASRDTSVSVWDFQSGERIGMLAANAAIHSLALSTDGNVLVVGDDAGAVRIIDVVGG